MMYIKYIHRTKSNLSSPILFIWMSWRRWKSSNWMLQWRHLCRVLTYIRSLLIEKDGCVRRNILILFPCVCSCACPPWSLQFLVRVLTFLSLILNTLGIIHRIIYHFLRTEGKLYYLPLIYMLLCSLFYACRSSSNNSSSPVTHLGNIVCQQILYLSRSLIQLQLSPNISAYNVTVLYQVNMVCQVFHLTPVDSIQMHFSLSCLFLFLIYGNLFISFQISYCSSFGLIWFLAKT